MCLAEATDSFSSNPDIEDKLMIDHDLWLEKSYPGRHDGELTHCDICGCGLPNDETFELKDGRFVCELCYYEQTKKEDDDKCI